MTPVDSAARPGAASRTEPTGADKAMMAAAQELMNEMTAAYRKGDADGCAALFTVDATLFSPFARAAKGRAAIAALHRDWTAGGAGNKVLTVLEAAQSGDMGWCLAAYSEGAATGDGTSLSILVRAADGQWRISFCALTADEPPLGSP